jgi:hypothetical protein
MKKILFSIVLLFSIITFSGCTQDQVAAYQKQVDQLTVVADQAYEASRQAKESAAKARAESDALRLAATTQPASEAKNTIKAADNLDAVAKKIDEYSVKADAALLIAKQTLDASSKVVTAASTGDTAGLGSAISGALSGTPLGPWGSVVGVLASLGWGIFQTINKNKQVTAATTNLANVVKSIEAIPAEWDAETKRIVATVQGADTSAAVEKIKKESGL